MAAMLGVIALVAVAVGFLAGHSPQLAIGAALGFAFVLAVLADLTLGLACFAALTFLEQLSIAGPALSVAKLAGLLLALSWLAAMATRPRAARESFIGEHPVMTVTLVLFLAWNAISILWAAVPSDVLLTVQQYALNVVLFLIVFTAVRDEDDVATVLGGFFVGALITATYGILNPPPPESVVQASRVTSTVGDPNELALLLVAGLTLSAGALGLGKGHTRIRLLAPITGAACLLALFLTVSRGGLISLGVALIAGVVFAGRWRLIALTGALFLVTVSVGYFAFFAPATATQRIESVTSGQQREEEGRATLWEIAWRMFKANPVEGVGAGNFQTSSIHYLLQPGTVLRSDQIVEEPAIAHNTYLQTISETGTVGGIGLLTIFGFALVCALRAARLCARTAQRGIEAVSRALAATLVATYVGDFFLTNQYSKQLWLLLGLAPALLAAAKLRAGKDDPAAA
jgi:O-antigen ligase